MTQESIDIFYIFGECFQNCLLTISLSLFPERRDQGSNSFQRFIDRFDKIRTVKYEKYEIDKKPPLQSFQRSTSSIHLYSGYYLNPRKCTVVYRFPPFGGRFPKEYLDIF